MTLNQIINRANTLIAKYYEKYERLPNAILINENILLVLEHCLPNIELKPSEKTECQIMGLTIIPIKYGKMQVVEILK